MIKIRVIPTLLWQNSSLVKGINFKNRRIIADLLPSIKIYNLRDVDELIILDINATSEKRDPDKSSIIDFTNEMSVPFTYGGGIKSLNHARMILLSGADKISLNTILFEDIKILREISKLIGSQSVVCSVDVKKIDNEYFCFSNSGTKKQKKNFIEWLKIFEDNGCGEILLNSIDQEGTMTGYDFDLINIAKNKINLPIIVSGGAGNYEDMYKAIKHGASAVAASSMFQFSEQTPIGARKYLFKKGINVRDGFKFID
ncbi:imidazole glycerol phosphate synthase cyclase subunit [Candidatus Pelagibacter sp.]|jgi:cyclase|nr:imidazole glycerol phosphate synthase cyclase subunit [Candidatus Pelagibacter sp.]